MAKVTDSPAARPYLSATDHAPGVDRMATVERFEPQALNGIAWGEITAAWLMAGVALLVLWVV